MYASLNRSPLKNNFNDLKWSILAVNSNVNVWAIASKAVHGKWRHREATNVIGHQVEGPGHDMLNERGKNSRMDGRVAELCIFQWARNPHPMMPRSSLGGKIPDRDEAEMGIVFSRWGKIPLLILHVRPCFPKIACTSFILEHYMYKMRVAFVTVVDRKP